MQEDTILVSEGVVGQIVINRPQNLNALNIDVFQGLLLALEKLSRLSELRVVTIWGAGDKAFAAGTDIPGLARLGKRAAAEYFELGQRTMRAVERFKVPVVAAVHGYAFGAGLELALAADIIVAAHDTQVGLPEAGLGLIPAFGGIARLLKRTGPGAAKRLIYSGGLINAEEALRYGVVDKVAAPEKLTEEVTALTTQITASGPLALAKAKSIITACLEDSSFALIRRGVEACQELYQTADCEEGLEAFMQKREAVFKGR